MFARRQNEEKCPCRLFVPDFGGQNWQFSNRSTSEEKKPFMKSEGDDDNRKRRWEAWNTGTHISKGTPYNKVGHEVESLGDHRKGSTRSVGKRVVRNAISIVRKIGIRTCLVLPRIHCCRLICYRRCGCLVEGERARKRNIKGLQ